MTYTERWIKFCDQVVPKINAREISFEAAMKQWAELERHRHRTEAAA